MCNRRVFCKFARNFGLPGRPRARPFRPKTGYINTQTYTIMADFIYQEPFPIEKEGKYTLPEIREKLEQIRNAPGASKRALVLMSGLGSGCFCLMFGGMWQDCVAAFVIGCLLYLYLLWLNGRCSKIVENIGGGIIITVCSLLFIHMPFGMDMSHMISGSIMPLVPGLAFTNGIRDIADGDYISGTVRMIDAVLVFLSVAAGVGCVLSIYHHLTGGVML